MQTPTLLEMMTRLIGEPSVSCTLPEWDQSNLGVIELLASWLEPLGFQCEVLPVPDYPGKANLVATRGSGDGGLVLAGHTDTVPFNAELWQSDPFTLTERDQRFYGLGSCDMKAFFALAIEAIKALDTRDLNAPLIILATADEESSMSGARALANSGYPRARYAVVGEPTSLTPVRMHKGIMMESLRIKGGAGHSSNPALGASALDAMHSALGTLLSFRQELQENHQNSAFDVSVPTLNLGCVHGGDNPNRICGQCDLEYDLRPLPGMNIANLREEVDKRLAPIADQFGVELTHEPLFPGVPSFETAKTADLVATAERLTGQASKAVAFATEAPFLQSLGMETIVLGPGSIDQAHQPDEYLAFDQIQPTIDLLQQLIQRYCLAPHKESS